MKIRFVFNDGGGDQRLEGNARESSKSAKLEASGVDVRFVNKVMHYKFMIVDGPRDDLAAAKTARIVSGSANWSNSAATRYDENTLFVSGEEELALRMQREFDLMWAHSRDFEGKPFDHELSTAAITDDAIPDSPDVDALFTSANFSVRGTTLSTTGDNTVANAIVRAIQGATTSIHVASGHLRSRPIAEALIARKEASPDLDVRVYLDGQEYISRSGHRSQLQGLESCLASATTETQRRNCTDKGFLFGYQVAEAGVEVRYKTYAYRWNHSYAAQMHHKYIVVDGETLFTGSYNLSDNAEHETFENMLVFRGARNAALVRTFEDNFEAMWKTGRDEDLLGSLLEKVETAPEFPIVFPAMALTWSEVTNLRATLRANCPPIDTPEWRRAATAHMTCRR